MSTRFLIFFFVLYLSFTNGSYAESFEEVSIEMWDLYLETCVKFNIEITEFLLFVNIKTQTLHLFHLQKEIATHRISTALNGAGQEIESGKTPLGLHRIVEKIGDGAALLAVFRQAKLTKEKAIPNKGQQLVCGRLALLIGLEPNFNQGSNLKGVNVDSYERRIYLHGTNYDKNIGCPLSGGCIRISYKEVESFFDKFPEGTHLYVF